MNETPEQTAKRIVSEHVGIYEVSSTECYDRVDRDGLEEAITSALAAANDRAERLREALEGLYNYEARRSSPDTAYETPMMTRARQALNDTPEPPATGAKT